MAKEAWTRRERMTARITAPTGEVAAIRPIDPAFWSEDGNIEIGRYFREQDEYLATHRRQNQVVYHYTGLEALHGIVNDGALWASDASHLNDRAELRYALENMGVLIAQQWATNPQPLDAIFRPGLAGQFIACLSRSRDQLSQWRAYGKKVGVAIAFDRQHLAHVVEAQRGAIVECRYLRPNEFSEIQGELASIKQSLMSPGALNADGALIDMKLQQELTDRAVRTATSIKHPSFEEEQEVRLVFSVKSASEMLNFRSSPQSLTPYLKIDIDGRRISSPGRRRFTNHLGMLEVIVWPNDVDDQILDAIDLLFSSAGGVLIHRSASPYRT